MARGGINKAVVQKAREALLARGVNPSIDAVRSELGNTGSKTTIHRYLKEIETADPRPIAAPGRLSDELTNLVGQLLQRLLEEGNAVLAHERKLHDEKVAALEEHIESLEETLAQKDHELAARDAALQEQAQELQISQSSLQAELTRNARISQSCSDLELRVQEKDEQVRSLEDKHTHSRDALEHYRNAVKEQREQDQRRHEGQIQQIQIEVKQLQQTLSVKQDELTRLNRDNERLLGESRQQSRAANTQHDKIQQLEGEIRSMAIVSAKREGAVEQLEHQVAQLRQDIISSRDSASEASKRAEYALRDLASQKVELEQAREELTKFRANDEEPPKEHRDDKRKK